MIKTLKDASVLTADIGPGCFALTRLAGRPTLNSESHLWRKGIWMKTVNVKQLLECLRTSWAHRFGFWYLFGPDPDWSDENNS